MPSSSSSNSRPRPREKVYALPDCGGSCSVVDMQSSLAVIVTHPWKPLGGNMHNNVVVAACLYFQHLGITTARFDFIGLYSRGYNHVKQVQEVANLLLSGKASSNSKPPQSILLVGYSYGSLITGSASAEIPHCIGTVSIAPPFTVQCWLLFFNSKYHLNQAAIRNESSFVRLFVIGDDDNFTSESAFKDVLETQFPHQQGTTTGAVIKGADHFFWKREKDLMDVIGQWLLKTFDDQCAGNLKNLRTAEFANTNSSSTTSKTALARSTSASAVCASSTTADMKVGSCFS